MLRKGSGECAFVAFEECECRSKEVLELLAVKAVCMELLGGVVVVCFEQEERARVGQAGEVLEVGGVLCGRQSMETAAIDEQVEGADEMALGDVVLEPGDPGIWGALSGGLKGSARDVGCDDVEVPLCGFDSERSEACADFEESFARRSMCFKEGGEICVEGVGLPGKLVVGVTGVTGFPGFFPVGRGVGRGL